MKKKISSYVVMIVLCVSMVSPVTGNDAGDILLDDVYLFIYENIISISKDSVLQSLWSDATKISDVYVCYDHNENINAYVIELSTNGIPHGYMEISLMTGEPVLDGFGFEGTSYLHEMFDSCGIADIPLMLTCVSYEGGDDHTICVFGHVTNTLCVINGWSTSITYKSYSGLDIFDYYYIAYE